MGRDVFGPDPAPQRKVAAMTTAFVLSGGGNLGSVQVGMLQALWERGIKPDLIVGASVGSLNGAWLATRGPDTDLAALVGLWKRLRRNDVFPARPLRGLSGFLGRNDHLVPSTGLRAIIRNDVGRGRLEDTSIPLHVVATDLLTGADVLLSRGDLADAVCASAAIPGVYPIVEIDGRFLVDGGVVNNCPISHAVELGASTVWVLPCGYACALPSAPKGALASALQAINVLVRHRLVVDIERYRHQTDLHVLPTLCPVNVGPTDFTQAERLISDSYQLAREWFDDPGVGQGPGLHDHRS